MMFELASLSSVSLIARHTNQILLKENYTDINVIRYKPVTATSQMTGLLTRSHKLEQSMDWINNAHYFPQEKHINTPSISLGHMVGKQAKIPSHWGTWHHPFPPTPLLPISHAPLIQHSSWIVKKNSSSLSITSTGQCHKFFFSTNKSYQNAIENA
jgi:hypothetical protein